MNLEFYRERLKEIIKEKALLVSDRENFILSSGKRSKYYIDMRVVSLDPEGINLIALCLFEKIKKYKVKYIGGLETGSIPLITALCIISEKKGNSLFGFYVKKEKENKKQKRIIEGNLKKGNRVLIIDDVITSGNSVLKVIEAVKNFNCEVVGVVSIVDRKEGAKEKLSKFGVQLESLFTIDEFV